MDRSSVALQPRLGADPRAAGLPRALSLALCAALTLLVLVAAPATSPAGPAGLFTIAVGSNPGAMAVNPVTNTVYVADYMEGAPIQTFGPYTVTPTTPFTPDIGARGRLCMLRLDCITANTFWRYGKPLAVISISGRGTSR